MKENAKKLSFLRRRIDALDNRIIPLLEKRLAAAAGTALYKKKKRDKNREKKVLAAVAGKAADKNLLPALKKIYSAIMAQALALQEKK